MDKFEEVLNKAQAGDGRAMEQLLNEYMTLIDGLVFRANKDIDKEDFRQYLIIKFIENTKSFKKIKKIKKILI